MKKWSYLLSGILIGAVVATAGNAFADQVKSLIGEKVAGEYTVKVNGSSLTENAIVVDGKAHVPLRAVSDSLGAGIKVDGKTIQIDTQSNTESSVEPKKESGQTIETGKDKNSSYQGDRSEETKEYWVKTKGYWEQRVNDTEDSQVKLNKQLDTLTNLPASKDPITQESRKNSIARTQGLIEENNKKIVEYKAKISEIEGRLEVLNK
ncbi:2,' 3'-cyclic nucleotide 2'-phosphodiesterase [Paenibacillus sp. EKM202P]|uniref:2,' 3'-cyclic nucleotide 2'-phosphodiesterase n=1 Tax=unclassified Paenibacillus TaxID=185978 RepID=UPI0013EA5A42|nr:MULTISPECIES: 2,' 3'-cyclic nucleotide 2'-phosphodiesterase [unclassified Paenibacillus]KAF6564535.1 2,' 3'-cyclic nucleotide 2'-phosphodiesterase [Paenibacillus sp. EKM202P]KAF6571650.1 2,' 3'-cyclic nucleotide 2'-phosphodiesterase [Paenibacillus sp. EKM207P]